MGRTTALQRLQQQEERRGDDEFYAIDAPDFKRQWPELYDVLYRLQQNGQHRDPGRISIFIDHGQLKVGIFIPTEARMSFLSLSDPQEVFNLLESKLATEGLECRPDK